MNSIMKSDKRPEEGVFGGQEPPEEVIDQLTELLPEGALDEAVKGLKPEELSGPGGLLSRLAGRVIEAALEAEMTEHLGHPSGGVPQGPNVRNGVTAKTVHTDLGPVGIRTPRDREGSFEPQLVPLATDTSASPTSRAANRYSRAPACPSHGSSAVEHSTQ
jgi:hypothetical protein